MMTSDAFGEHLTAYWLGRESFQIIERDDGFISFTGATGSYFAPFERWPRHEQDAIEAVLGRVLDVGAGAGRVATYLQQTGRTVVAIDNSVHAVALCKAHSVNDARLMSIDEVGSFGPDCFDSIVFFGDNFGLLGGKLRARRILTTLYQVTSPGAIILAESTNIFDTTERCHLDYYRRNELDGRMPGQLRLRIRFKQFMSNWFDWLMVSVDQMDQILDGTGWYRKRLYGSSSSQYVALLGKIPSQA